MRPVGGSTRYGSQASRGEEQELALQVGRQVIGRSPTAGLRMLDMTLCLEHAELEVADDGRVIVRDLASVNGVMVDGVPVAQAELHNGNRLQLGEVQLVFRTELGADTEGRQGGEFE